MLATDNDELAEHLRILRSHGMTSLSWDRHKGHAWSYDVVDLGYNYRIDEMRSALGRVQIKKVGANNQRRAALTALYRELIVELAPEIQMPFKAQRGTSCYHILPVLLPEGMDRLRFMEGMKMSGVQTSIHYPPVHQFKIYHDEWQKRGFSLPVTEDVAAREVTLPLYPTMSDGQVEWVVQAIKDTLQNNAV